MHRELNIINRISQTAKRTRGYTLTEVVVASALLIIVMVPILKALTTAHVSEKIIKTKTQSLILAKNKLEGIKARSIYHYSNSFTETDTSLGGSYLCTVIDTGPASDLRQITLKVGYDLNNNSVLDAQEIHVTLDTLLARRWQN